MKLKRSDGSVVEIYQKLTGPGIEMSREGAIDKIARDLKINPYDVRMDTTHLNNTKGN